MTGQRGKHTRLRSWFRGEPQQRHARSSNVNANRRSPVERVNLYASLSQATFDYQTIGVVARVLGGRVRGSGYATHSRLKCQAPGSDPIRQCVAVL
jgi:hypothetical protein